MDEWDIIRLMSSKIYKTKDWVPNDVSYVKIEENKFLAISIDTLVGKTDVPPGMSLFCAGRKAAINVISDLASKGIKPVGMMFSISIPRTYGAKEVEEIAKGLRKASDEYSFDILGGDTNESDDLVITCCGFGFTEKMLGRDGATPGDLVYVTGYFGLTGLGLRMLIKNLSPENELEKAAIDSVLWPQARLNEGITAISTGAVTSSIDSSDGLSISLHQIAETSDVKILIENLPIYPGIENECKKFGFDLDSVVLGSGEEFELIFTVNPRKEKSFIVAMSKIGVKAIKIGKVLKGRGVFIIKNGKEQRLEKIGWTHFTS